MTKCDFCEWSNRKGDKLVCSRLSCGLSQTEILRILALMAKAGVSTK